MAGRWSRRTLGEQAPAGERLLGEFFFVHAPEATAAQVRRGYEFLHATFAEYLVATKVVEVLTDVAEGSFGRRDAVSTCPRSGHAGGPSS